MGPESLNIFHFNIICRKIKTHTKNSMDFSGGRSFRTLFFSPVIFFLYQHTAYYFILLAVRIQRLVIVSYSMFFFTLFSRSLRIRFIFFVLFFLQREKSFAFVVKICLGILISGSPFYHEAKRIYIAYQTCKLVYWLSCCGAR